MTVGELLDLLSDLDRSVWVCIDGDGPALGIVQELGANEPFVIVVGESDE